MNVDRARLVQAYMFMMKGSEVDSLLRDFLLKPECRITNEHMVEHIVDELILQEEESNR